VTGSFVPNGVIGPMAGTAPAGPAFLEVQVAPYRRGFLVCRGDTGQLRSALLGAATIWGGMRCPILPVEPDGSIAPKWLQVASAIDPFVLVDFTTGAGDGESAWRGAASSSWPVIPAQPLTDGGFWGLHPIGAHQPEELKHKTLFVPTGRTLLDAASAGCVELADEVEWWRREINGVLEVDSLAQLASAQLGGHTVLAATAVHDTDSSASAVWVSMALLWLTDDPDDPDEVIAWWNTRALRPRLWYPGISILSTPDAVLGERFADDLRSVVRHHVFTRPDLVIASRGLPDERLHEVGERLGFKRHETDNVTETPFGVQPDLDRQLTYMTRADLLGWWGADRVSGTTNVAAVYVQRPTTRFREPSPLGWNPGLFGAGAVSFRVSGKEITGPQLPEVAGLYHKGARWHHGRLEILAQAQPVYDLELDVPEPHAVLEAACAASRVTYTLSDKARHVHGVWALARDPGMFRQPAIVDVIKVLTPESSRELIKQLRESSGLSDDEKEELRRLAAANRVTMRTLPEIASHYLCSPSSRVSAAAALQDLVTCGMVLRGLRADCPVCSVQHLYELDQARPVPRCPGCGSDAAYSIDDRGEPALYYRINTLVQTLSVNGGLAPLAATSLLVAEGAYVVPGAQLRHDGYAAGEVDLLGWRDHTLLAGEAKMSARQLSIADHDKDVSKSVLVGAREHIAACLETVPAETRNALHSACKKAGIELVILDAPELLTGSGWVTAPEVQNDDSAQRQE
jgi:hypothetical protein